MSLILVPSQPSECPHQPHRYGDSLPPDPVSSEAGRMFPVCTQRHTERHTRRGPHISAHTAWCLYKSPYIKLHGHHQMDGSIFLSCVRPELKLTSGTYIHTSSLFIFPGTLTFTDPNPIYQPAMTSWLITQSPIQASDFSRFWSFPVMNLAPAGMYTNVYTRRDQSVIQKKEVGSNRKTAQMTVTR